MGSERSSLGMFTNPLTTHVAWPHCLLPKIGDGSIYAYDMHVQPTPHHPGVEAMVEHSTSLGPSF